jgi:hypothetical protein
MVSRAPYADVVNLSQQHLQMMKLPQRALTPPRPHWPKVVFEQLVNDMQRTLRPPLQHWSKRKRPPLLHVPANGLDDLHPEHGVFCVMESKAVEFRVTPSAQVNDVCFRRPPLPHTEWTTVRWQNAARSQMVY